MDINAIERQSSTPGLISGTMLVIATVVGGGMFSLPSNADFFAKTRASAVCPLACDHCPTKDSRRLLMPTAPLFRQVANHPASPLLYRETRVSQ